MSREALRALNARVAERSLASLARILLETFPTPLCKTLTQFANSQYRLRCSLCLTKKGGILFEERLNISLAKNIAQMKSDAK